MTKCFVCNSSSTETILDLGKSPVANNLELDKTKSQKSKKYALNLILCKSKCTHVQIGKIVDQKEIYHLSTKSAVYNTIYSYLLVD